MSLDGIIVVDKPEGWTSHDVVNRMRGIAGTRRVGHLGTLDPLATGVLPVMIGQATRLARFWGDSEKAYRAVVRFGFATNTYDRDGERRDPAGEPHLTQETLEACLAPMRGEILQTPPPVSAKKINGVPAYKLARRNETVELAPCRVTIHELSLEGIEGDCARIFMRCSAGAYVRSIAHELGLALGCGAHIERLERTVSGPFRIEQSHTLEELQKLKDRELLEEALLRLPDLLPEFPNVFVDDVTTRRIRQGRDFNVSPFRVPAGSAYVKAIGPDGTLVAIGQIVLPNFYHPAVVFETTEAIASRSGVSPMPG
ncbi:MAG: tRNA pseudouridine(55) synthase TruB [Acidobacteriota bacterium]|nr:tRNA pseudouridine(55) synthase TruB [Acidobacteriota bacterium]